MHLFSGNRPERRRVYQKSLQAVLAIALYLSLSPQANAFSVSATVDRNPIYQDESVSLVLKAEGEAIGGLEPDLTPLANDFEIISQSSHTNINIVNNVPTVSQSWIYEIQPKHRGPVVIPPISIGGVLTQAIQLEVIEFHGNFTGAGADIFLETQVSNSNPYVQSQVNFTTRLFFSISILNGELTEPRVNFGAIERVSQDKHYKSNRGGKEYQVIERQHVIFPERSGSFSIPSVEFVGVVERIDPATNQAWNPRERYSAQSIDIDVRPIPSSFTGTTWLPAIDLQLEDSWNGKAPKLEQGSPQSRKITINAVGLRAVQLPSVDFGETSSARIYGGNNAALNTHNGVDWTTARRTDEFAIVPQHDTTVEIPKFEIVWWDVTQDRERITTLPTIYAPVGATAATDQMAVNGTGTQSVLVGSEGGDSVVDFRGRVGQWKIATAALLLAWLATMLAWYFGGKTARVEAATLAQEQIRKTESERQLIRGIRQACSQGDASTVGQRLLHWSQVHWPNQPPRNLMQLAKNMHSNELIAELENLDRTNYSAQVEPWDGRRMWRQFSQALRNKSNQHTPRKRWFRSKSRDDLLEDLWPSEDASAT